MLILWPGTIDTDDVPPGCVLFLIVALILIPIIGALSDRGAKTLEKPVPDTHRQIQIEAVQRGYAEFVADSVGTVRFVWKEKK